MISRLEFFNTTSSILDVTEKNVALLILKVCRIKDINTTYGFSTGDKYLEYVEGRLKLILRPTDILCRIGDHDFGLLLPALKNTAHASLAANKIISEFQHPVDIGGVLIPPRMVIGISVKPDHGDTLDELLHAATLALHLAEVNDEDYLMHQVSKDETPASLILENEMQFALDNDEFSLFCQPKINLQNQKIYGGESLIRWNSHKFGFINTQYMIDILESSRSLLPVTKWVLNGAIRQCIEYQNIIPDFTIAINLSPSLLSHRTIVDVISSAVNIWSIDPSHLIIEVTEGAMMTNPRKSLKILNEIHDQGYGISIDDFGSGYSSLAYLKNLPADELKIDKSFVLNMVKDENDMSIVKAAVDLAHTLGLKTVAEGAEDKETMALLSEIGCDYVQGYYVSKPLPYDDFKLWLNNNQWN
jgi:diguanylate cyclase (GGDEF)-like protein